VNAAEPVFPIRVSSLIPLLVPPSPEDQVPLMGLARRSAYYWQ